MPHAHFAKKAISIAKVRKICHQPCRMSITPNWLYIREYTNRSRIELPVGGLEMLEKLLLAAGITLSLQLLLSVSEPSSRQGQLQLQDSPIPVASSALTLARN